MLLFVFTLAVLQEKATLLRFFTRIVLQDKRANQLKDEGGCYHPSLLPVSAIRVTATMSSFQVGVGEGGGLESSGFVMPCVVESFAGCS